MIKNQREYRITRAQAEKIRRALAEFAAEDSGTVPPRLRKAQENGLRSQLEELDEELAKYEHTD